ncbi:MAG: hypothetical protein K8R73_04675 [Clostridiales bacterium]|nr:hypothetical protein [Clostridiales bacterium]
MKLKLKDWILIGVTLIVLIVLGYKSIVMDPVEPKDSVEEAVVVRMQEVLDETHSNILYKTGIMKFRITDVKVESEDDFTGRYRKYLLGVLPFGDSYFSSEDQ